MGHQTGLRPRAVARFASADAPSQLSVVPRPFSTAPIVEHMDEWPKVDGTSASTIKAAGVELSTASETSPNVSPAVNHSRTSLAGDIHDTEPSAEKRDWSDDRPGQGVASAPPAANVREQVGPQQIPNGTGLNQSDRGLAAELGAFEPKLEPSKPTVDRHQGQTFPRGNTSLDPITHGSRTIVPPRSVHQANEDSTVGLSVDPPRAHRVDSLRGASDQSADAQGVIEMESVNRDSQIISDDGSELSPPGPTSPEVDADHMLPLRRHLASVGSIQQHQQRALSFESRSDTAHPDQRNVPRSQETRIKPSMPSTGSVLGARAGIARTSDTPKNESGSRSQIGGKVTNDHDVADAEANGDAVAPVISRRNVALPRIQPEPIASRSGASDSKKTVNINIGRVELRCEESSRPKSPPSVAADRPSMVMSLDEYMQRREAGGIGE